MSCEYLMMAIGYITLGIIVSLVLYKLAKSSPIDRDEHEDM